MELTVVDSLAGRIRIEASPAAASAVALKSLRSVRRGAAGEGELTIRLLSATDQRSEGYSLEFAPETINVSAADDRGFRHAGVTLEALITSDYMPTGRIEDWPRLAMRGFHLNLESYRRIGIDRAMSCWRRRAAQTQYRPHRIWPRFHLVPTRSMWIARLFAFGYARLSDSARLGLVDSPSAESRPS
jgi:hypothetical protein